MAEPILRCERLHKSYVLGRTSLSVLRGISLDVEAGRFVAITGASGSGKSTLLHVMSGLDVPQRGQVFYRGDALFESEADRRIPVGRDASAAGATAGASTGAAAAKTDAGRSAASGPRGPRAAGGAVTDPRVLESRRNTLRNEAFGFVFQLYYLLPEFDVVENVLLPRMVGSTMGGWLSTRAEGADRALELLKRVGLGDRLRHRPNELSGGERQRVAIARAMMNRPEVLFADEPTGNLDGATGLDIFNLLKELNDSGQTIVMVTHDRDLASRVDVIVHLVDGRVK